MAIAIITGASSGIGRQFALEIEKTGEVDGFLLIARTRTRLEKLAEELRTPAEILEADLSTEEGIERVRAYLTEKNPTVQYLVNAAGYGIFGDYTEVTEQETVGMIDLNIKATVLLSHMTVPYMPKGSHILEVGSASVFTPLPGFNIYASTKAFVYHYAQALAYELRPCGIAVTVFCPGWVKTEFFNRAVKDDTIKYYNKFFNSADVVRRAVYDMYRGKDVSVIGASIRAQVLLTKLLPHKAVMKIWCKQQKK